MTLPRIAGSIILLLFFGAILGIFIHGLGWLIGCAIFASIFVAAFLLLWAVGAIATDELWPFGD